MDNEPLLDLDLARLLREFQKLSRMRPQSLGKVPQALSLSDLISGWELSNLRRSMTRKDYVEVMQELDSELIDFYIKRDG